MTRTITYPVYDPQLVWGLTGRTLPAPGIRAWCYRTAGRLLRLWRLHDRGTEPEQDWITCRFRALEVEVS